MKNKESSIALLRVLALIGILAILAFTSSCESKSGQLNKIPAEKVVILDMFVKMNDVPFKYRVKRIEHGVTDVIYDQRLFECGDTVFHKFITW